MKRILFFSCILMVLLSGLAMAASDKINPDDYICAEYVTTISIEHAPPLFEGLQIDGYASAKEGNQIADPRTLPPIMLEVYALCQSQPEAKVLPLWQKVRTRLNLIGESRWKANKTLCEQYNKDPDDGSGFVIWLDGYMRGLDSTDRSVLKSDLDLNNFIQNCRREPKKLMLDVMRQSAH
ncbi:MAG: hypothetical protein IJU40_00605 [Desulfovibrionaceae bacterium]|nr:hypothetical protein [Desulfovibrionaceae bacterium]